MAGAIPPKPQINASTDIWGFKYWIDKVQTWITGEAATNPVIQTASFNILADATYLVYQVDTSSGNITATLPTAAGMYGKKYTFKITNGVNSLTITPNVADTIDGASSYVLSGYKAAVTIISDGLNTWNVIAGGAGASVANGGTTNLITNGGFEIWQSGTLHNIPFGTSTRSGIVGGTLWMLPDHWSALNTVGVIANSFSQVPGLTVGSQYGMRVQRLAGNTGTGNLFLIQDVGSPNSILAAGQQCTLSFDIRLGANISGPVSITWVSGTGLNQARRNVLYTGEVNLLTPAVQLVPLASTNTTRVSFTRTVPANSTEQAIFFTFSPTGTAGAADYFEVDNIQINIGNGSIYQKLPFEQDLFNCLSWVQKSFNYAQLPAQATGSIAGAYTYTVTNAGASPNEQGSSNRFVPNLRSGAVPVALTYNPIAASNTIRNVSASTNSTTTPALSANESSFTFSARFTSPTVGDTLAVHYVIDGGI